MSCSDYHFLLSLNLDGRLPSARRDALLDHLTDCAACARLADEMRGAQELALGLPRAEVGPGFQRTLWERIRAGEGTPQAVFADPVPMTKRIRYAASGAAAAALFLVALNWVEGMVGPEEPPARIQHSVASVGRPAPAIAAASDVDPVFAEPASLSPSVVAQRAQHTLVRSAEDLPTRMSRFQAKLASEPALRIRSEIADDLIELRTSTAILRLLADENFITLPTDFQAEIRFAQKGLDLLDQAAGREDVAAALSLLGKLDTQNFGRRFAVICCDTNQAFLDRFFVLSVNNPQVSCVLRLTLPNGQLFEPGLEPTNPMNRVLVMPEPQVDPARSRR